MTTFFFPDTTVLLNFEVIDRWPLLARLVAQRGRWVAAVESEALDWLGTFPDLHGHAAALFGVPERPENGGEHVSIRTLRDDMAAPGDGPLKHLGEAETIVILESRFAGGCILTDDQGARRSAAARGITCIGTLDLLSLARRREWLTDDEHAADVRSLKAANRHPASFHGD